MGQAYQRRDRAAKVFHPHAAEYGIRLCPITIPLPSVENGLHVECFTPITEWTQPISSAGVALPLGVYRPSARIVEGKTSYEAKKLTPNDFGIRLIRA